MRKRAQISARQPWQQEVMGSWITVLHLSAKLKVCEKEEVRLQSYPKLKG